MKKITVRHFTERSASVILSVGAPGVADISEQMEAINEQAYMNGYNWDAFLAHYLRQHHRDLLDGLKTDPEADTYVAYYPASPANQVKAEQLASVLDELLHNPQKIYDFLRAEGENIEWD